MAEPDLSELAVAFSEEPDLAEVEVGEEPDLTGVEANQEPQSAEAPPAEVRFPTDVGPGWEQHIGVPDHRAPRHTGQSAPWGPTTDAPGTDWDEVQTSSAPQYTPDEVGVADRANEDVTAAWDEVSTATTPQDNLRGVPALGEQTPRKRLRATAPDSGGRTQIAPAAATAVARRLHPAGRSANRPPLAASTSTAPSSNPATQARNTAAGLRKLTKRIPGASLPYEDNSLRRSTPTSTTRNPLELTEAVSRYLSAATTDGQPDKERS